MIPISSLELNVPSEKWYPLMPGEDDELPVKVEQYEKKVHVVVYSAKGLMPGFKRLDVDPQVAMTLIYRKLGEEEGGEMETTELDEVKTRPILKAMDPVWEPHEAFVFDCGEDEMPHSIRGEIYDAGTSSKKDPVVVGYFNVDLSSITKNGLGHGLDHWAEIEYAKGIHGQGASIHVVVYTETRKVEEEDEEEEEEEEEDDLEGPRIKLSLVLMTAKEDHVAALDKAGEHALSLPSNYLDLAAFFTKTLSLASTSKPLVLILDGLHHLSTFDPASSMKWLPLTLPRYVHVIIGYCVQVRFIAAHPLCRQTCQTSAADGNAQKSCESSRARTLPISCRRGVLRRGPWSLS
jgi:hypothetical protein